MKKVFLFSLLLSGCSNGRNEMMTALLNNQKALRDSIKDAHNYEGYYIDRAKEKMHQGADSITWHSLVDSSTFYYIKGQDYNKKLEAVKFSLDSLSKMK